MLCSNHKGMAATGMRNDDGFDSGTLNQNDE